MHEGAPPRRDAMPARPTSGEEGAPRRSARADRVPVRLPPGPALQDCVVRRMVLVDRAARCAARSGVRFPKVRRAQRGPRPTNARTMRTHRCFARRLKPCRRNDAYGPPSWVCRRPARATGPKMLRPRGRHRRASERRRPRVEDDPRNRYGAKRRRQRTARPARPARREPRPKERPRRATRSATATCMAFATAPRETRGEMEVVLCA